MSFSISHLYQPLDRGIILTFRVDKDVILKKFMSYAIYCSPKIDENTDRRH